MKYTLILVAALFSFAASAQAPSVVSVSPASGALPVSPDTDIVVDFDTAIDPNSINSSTFRVSGKWSGPATGSFTLENSDQRVRFTPDEPFLMSELVMVNLSKGVESAGEVPMELGYAWTFWSGSDEQTTLDLVEVGTLDLRMKGEGNIISYGAYAGDLNNDGFSDLSIPNESSVDVRVMMNDGKGYYDSFTVHGLPGGALPSPSDGGDFNEDGEIDIAVGNAGNDRVSVMLGDGTGDFSSITSMSASGSGVRGIVVFDANGDGHDDIVTTSRVTGTLDYFEGLGDGTFEDRVTFDAGGSGETAVAAADANGDGLLDLFVGALHSDEVMIMLSNGDGSFTLSDTMESPGGAWMMGAGDFNGDGHVDAVTAGEFAHLVAVLFGDGTGHFTSISTFDSGNFTIAIDVGDLDNDGDLDLVSSNYSSRDFYVYENDGNGNFTHVQTLEVGGAGSCAIIHDANNDGFPDVVGVDERDDRVFFYRLQGSLPTVADNESPEMQRLDVRLNPFRGSNTIDVWLAANQHVHLRVFDVRGRQVASLFEGELAAGPRTISWDATSLPSGTYVVRLDTERGGATSQVTVLR
ncbi:MAG: FG-GAP-like repeat-containing protein [Rubricoccaceae bacterium]|nr:FG-GAP-like repeat-containing protein [Rubricoccaceae bacterium]